MYKVKKYKIKNGKLFEIKLEFSDKINGIKILGDFFIYPAEGLESIETELVNCTIKKEDIKKRIDECLEKNSIELIGIDSDSITTAIIEMSE